VVPDLVKFPLAVALYSDWITMGCGECVLNLVGGVCFCCGWENASSGKELITLADISRDPAFKTYSVTIKGLEKINSNVKIINDLGLLRISIIASRSQSRHASSMLVPLMLPETLIIPLVILPVGVHV